MKPTLLTRLGFTEGEAKVYLALLDLGNTSSGNIIKTSDVSRSKVYEILERLKHKGLVTESINNKIKFFQANSPKNLQSYLEKKEKQIEEERAYLSTVLPQLEEKYKEIKHPQEVKIYEGYKGLMSFYTELLSHLTLKDEMLAMTHRAEKWKNKQLQTFFEQLHRKRAERNIPARILYYEKDTLIKQRFDFSFTGKYTIRSVDFPLPAGIVIAKDIVATVTWAEEPKVFVIICKENADHYRDFFNSVWKKGK